MSDLVVRGRRGETIPVAEYPPGFMDDLNRRLNNIDDLEPEPDGWMDRAALWVFDNITDGRGFVVVIVIAGVATVGTVATQIGLLFQ